MMRWILLLPVALFWTSDVFALDFSLAPGLSIKNAMLYLIAAGLLFRGVMGAQSRGAPPRIRGYFAVLIGYAVATCVLADFVIRYPGYHLFPAIIQLKAQLIDPVTFCLVVFYGLRNDDDVQFFLKGLIGAVCLANVLTLADLVGLVHITSRVGEREVSDGRVYGFFGHANETGELIACLLPAMLALSASGGRLSRTLLYSGTVASALVFIMAVSRGAYVALLVSIVGGAYLCRRYVSLSRLLAWGGAALVATAAVVALACLIDPQIGAVLSDRVIGQSESVDVGVITSGRTDVWTTAIASMMDAPITLLTGYGWYAYESMPFWLSTHNYYLDLWFDLGLVGLAMFVLIMRQSIVTALSALEHASVAQRRHLIAFVCGVIAILVGIFFTLIFKPWPYLWMYIGAMLRASLIAESASETSPARVESVLPRPMPLRARGRHVPVGLN